MVKAVDKATTRILDMISSNIGDSISINELTNRMKSTYGSAYYANVYEKLQDLKEKGLLNLEPIGRSYSIKLNFNNYLLIDTLSEVEIEKKLKFLSNRANLFPFFAEMDKALNEKCCIRSICAINPLKNIKLNRIELLSRLNEGLDYLDQTTELHKVTLNLQRKFNLKINNLILDSNDFFDMLTSDEINPVREALSQQIILYNPQAFWRQIKETAQKNKIKTLHTETRPLSISESDLNFNLNRFGYSEFGANFVEGKKFCIEYIVTSLLLREEARGIDAVAVILAKNSFNSNLLVFLSQKYEVTPRLLGILNILGQTNPEQVDNTVKILKAINPQELPADENSIRQKLELYNAL
jgi:hypothetical protein